MAIAWIFLASLTLCLAAVPVMAQKSELDQAHIIVYLKAIGTVYSAPLGVIVASLFGAKLPIEAFDRKSGAFAIAATIIWNAFPLLLAFSGISGAFGKAPTGFGGYCDYLQQAAIPVNTAITAILTSLFPKPKSG